MVGVVHAVPAPAGERARWTGTAPKVLRRLSVVVALTRLILAGWPQAASAQISPATTADLSAPVNRDSGSSQAGTAGFVLIGGWMLGSGVLLWRGRRRLAQRAALNSPDKRPAADAEPGTATQP